MSPFLSQVQPSAPGKDLATLPQPASKEAVLMYSQDPLGFMVRCAQDFGEIVPLDLDGELYCLLTNPAHITEVFTDRRLFVKARDYRLLQGLLGNGLLTSEGDFWQRQRRLTQPVFHQQRISSYGAVMVDYAQKMLQTWHEGQVLKLDEEMMRLTLNIVMKTIFDQDVTDTQAGHISHALDTAMDWYHTQMLDSPPDMGLLSGLQRLFQFWQRLGLSPVSHKPNHQYRDALALLDQTLSAMIQERRSQAAPGDDLLGMLMQIEDADDGSRMSDQQLRDEVATMILAGHETTANTLSWTWMLLAQHPQVYQTLMDELRTVLAGRAPTTMDLPQLTYSTWIIKEAMRLYPPITDVSREATQVCQIGGYAIPKGTTLILSQWVMHHHASYFSDPDLFQPERWANDLEKQLPRGVYFPFSDGPRVCIGKNFALMEAVLILATIAQKFQLELLPGQTIELQPSLTLRPKYGIQVALKSVAQ
jgi:cytochrome P450